MDTKRITKNFLWSELIVSSSFPELAAKIKLDEKDQYNHYHLISTTLQPERENFDLAALQKQYPEVVRVYTNIEQGKRSLELYQALKDAGYNPSASSQHFCRNPFDCALDFQKIAINQSNKIHRHASIMATKMAFDWIAAACRFGFGQLYYSKPKNNKQIGFNHIGSVTPAHQGKAWIK